MACLEAREEEKEAQPKRRATRASSYEAASESAEDDGSFTPRNKVKRRPGRPRKNPLPLEEHKRERSSFSRSDEDFRPPLGFKKNEAKVAEPSFSRPPNFRSFRDDPSKSSVATEEEDPRPSKKRKFADTGFASVATKGPDSKRFRATA